MVTEGKNFILSDFELVKKPEPDEMSLDSNI